MAAASMASISATSAKSNTTLKILIMGASSGLGAELARLYSLAGHTVAGAARSVDKIANCDFRAAIDINSPESTRQLRQLIADMDGMDLYIHASGIGYDNPTLDPERDAAIATTNCVGFSRMIATAFAYFAERGNGHIAAITSVAGTKGIGGMEAYSASKRYDWTYLQGLRQRATQRKLNIHITDIRPGWTRTPLLYGNERYPMEMQPQKVCAAIVRAIASRRKRVVIDCRWALLQALWSLLPDALWHYFKV